MKECITYYALANGYSIWYERTSKDKIIAVCGQRKPKLKEPELGKQRKHVRYPSVCREETPKCSYRLYARWMNNEQSFQVISLKPEHTCVRNFEFGSLIDYKWLAKHFGDKIRKNPEIKLRDIADLVKKKYNCTVTANQCRAAKTLALTEYEKTLEEHYALIRSYGKELLDSNPGSTVKLGVTNTDGKTIFERFYVCFAGLKEGFKKGCRRVIALDGCFLKKPNQGEILTAIGRDGNNHIYPICWAVVSVENKDNWAWFLELLGDDIDMPTGQGLTLMSDQHKGLIEAVKQVMPDAEHRQCARHIYENFKKQFSGLEFRNLFWSACKASYPQRFNRIMDKIKEANPLAHKYLMDKNPKTWSRAFFELDRGCEAVENGFSECFNSVLVNVRDKPLLTMLEAMRVIVLERMNIMRKISAKWTDDICPSIKKRLDLQRSELRYEINYIYILSDFIFFVNH